MSVSKTMSKITLGLSSVATLSAVASQAAHADSYTVQAGDSFFSIAAKTNVDPYKLAAQNGKGIFDSIHPGDTLEIEGYQLGAAYTVKAGESFFSIAAKQGVDPYKLAAHNGKGIFDTIHPGTVLHIPGKTELAPEVEEAPAAQEAPVAPVAEAPAPAQETSYEAPAAPAQPEAQPVAEIAANPAPAQETPAPAAETPAPAQEAPAAQPAQEATPAPAAEAAQPAAQEATPAPAAQPAATATAQATSVNEPNTYPIGQCTWGVKEVAPWVGNWWGDAKYWAGVAASKGFQVGSTPAVGSVVVWPNGEYGHVAYVTDVDASTGKIQVMEANFNGDQTLSNKRGWFSPNDFSGGNVSYIYPN